MSRRKRTDVHPAIMAATLSHKEALQKWGGGIEGWEGFSQLQRAWLYVRQFTQFDAEACRYVDRSYAWLFKHIGKNPLLRKAVVDIRARAVEVGDVTTGEMQRLARWHLLRMLQSPVAVDTSKLRVISAILSLPDEQQKPGRGKVRTNVRAMEPADYREEPEVTPDALEEDEREDGNGVGETMEIGMALLEGRTA
jgi:hypothetical protein